MTVTSPSSRKVVLISGASSGIGAATARRLAAAGHAVVMGARRSDLLVQLEQEIRAAGGEALAVQLDVSDLASMEAFVTRAEAAFGHVDVLVNNAGVMPLSFLRDRRVDEWNQMIDVNLRGVLHGIAAVLPGMEARGSGQVINVSSVSGHRVDPTSAVYSATKFAVGAISEGLRQESRSVRVTVISPGYTRTELTQQGGSPDVQAMAQAATDEIGLPPAAIADAIAFAIDQPGGVDVNEIIVRPTLQG
jgi:NADP-dependent 3-hydroxy acid dehydrogenase YdfG